METSQGPSIVHYLPIATTIISAFFAAAVFRRYRVRGGGNHLLWWTGGILVYGAGTFAEGWITLFGWGPLIFKFWYIVGALLGGAPLAQGTVWLLLKPRTARLLTYALVIAVAVASTFVILSPINYAVVDPSLPSGSAFGWQWVRLFSPFLNTYAVIFLIGGAILSAWRFYKAASAGGTPVARDRFVGNVLIAVGAILPGFGGAASRAGHTEILYIMELIGIMLIWLGYWFNVRKRTAVPVRNKVAVTAVLMVLCVSALAPASVAAGESGTGRQASSQESLTIRITETEGMVLPRVVVSLRPVLGGAPRNLVTDRRGEVRFEGVTPGDYVLEAQKDGFIVLVEELSVGDVAGDPLVFAMQFRPIAEEVTVVATRTERDILNVPGEVSVIGRDEIVQTQARSLDDLLRYEPGVDMAESPRRLGQTINIRGFDDERVLILRDGARVSQYSSGHRGNLFFDIEDIETVEIVRGPASALYGSGALGGVVSVRTLDPNDLLSVGQSVGAQVRGSYSSAYGEWMVTPRAFGQSANGFGWLLGYTMRQNDGTVRLADEGVRLADAEEDVNDVNARVIVPASDRDFFRLSLGSYRNNGVTSTNLSDLEVTESGRVERRTAQFTTSLNYQRGGDNWWDDNVEATVYYTDMQIDEDRLVDGRVDEIGYRTWGLDARNTAALGDAQNLTYGVEIVRDRQEALRSGGAHSFFPDGTQSSTGVYVQDEVSLANGRISLVPGLRWDRWVSESPDPEIVGQNVNGFTPKVGGSWEFVDGAVVTASYGEGFRAPRFRETFLSGVHFAFPLPGDRFFLAVFDANPDLVPEESRNVDVGLRFSRGAVSARVAYWNADVRNFIELLPVFSTPFPPPGGTQVEVWRAENVTDATLEGVEAVLTWNIRAGLRANANYSNGRSRNDETGEPLLTAAAEKLVLGVEWSRFDIGTHLGLAARIYGAREEVPVLVEPTDGYTLVDFNFRWTPAFAPRFTGHFGVNNLTGENYTVALFNTPGTGRDFRFGVTLDLR